MTWLIRPKIGCTPETLRVWVRQHERDTVRQRLCVSGFASMSGIPGAVMGGSPPLNVSV
ncbi:hypothetical protein [Escherichia coli]|uniref:hypothetical protein n=1 Tax=Escherichia coli TaxID=562 RepID=UPI002022FAD0|nr:hypothetical protein [Escherichia coli]